jgi:hypothetical protein
MTDIEVNKIVKLCYNQFLEKTYDFNGLTLRPVLYDGRNGYEIFWEVENKNNLSCNETVVVDFIHDIISEFSLLVSNRENNVYRDYWKRLCKISTDIFPKGGMYINGKDRKKLNDILFNISEIDYKKFRCDIDFMDFIIDGSRGEDIYFNYKCLMTNVVYKGKELEDFSDEYETAICEIFYDESFQDYQYDLMRPFTREIVINPLLFDNTYMYLTNDFETKDEKGKSILC